MYYQKSIFNMHPAAATLQHYAQNAAEHGVLVGSSSWKFSGWCQSFYDEQRYLWHNKFAESRFKQHCLEEYAEILPSVGVDATYYKLPTEKYLLELAAQVPKDFLFSFKVSQDILLKRFTNSPRFGVRAGQTNTRFLDVELMKKGFLEPCEAIRDQVGVLLLVFSRFHPGEWERGRDFVQALDDFLGQLPTTWRYAVELRNASFLHPDYFKMLANHGVAHVYSNWTHMPPIEQQMEMANSRTADFNVARFMVKTGRTYPEAEKIFDPWSRVKEVLPVAREAGATLIREGMKQKGSRDNPNTFLYVTNDLEGCSPETLEGMFDLVGEDKTTSLS